ncbi:MULTISPECIES: hypothetical protein [unclassified Aeromicrobium]|uniref:hypothetical protein n=1 Tax=unclassified Aeromicrobium TaxID=2633570 RepID=UPI00288A9F93|nr:MULTISPECIES: hypothetical protein [unclassified Aeromicrobium]
MILRNILGVTAALLLLVILFFGSVALAQRRFGDAGAGAMLMSWVIAVLVWVAVWGLG